MDIYHATPPVPLPADTQKINEIVQLNKDRASIIFLRDQQKEEHIIYIVQRRSIWLVVCELGEYFWMSATNIITCSVYIGVKSVSLF